MDLIKKENYLQIDSTISRKVIFYFSYGSMNNMDRSANGGNKKHWTEMRFKNLDWRFNIFEGKDHNTSDIVLVEWVK